MSDATKNSERGNGRKVIIIVCVIAVVVIASLVGVIVALINKDNGANSGVAGATQQERRSVVTQDNAEEVAEEILSSSSEENIIPQSYVVTMNSTWEFADGQAVSDNAYVGNSTDNSTAVYFDLIRDDTGETIYKSPVIPVGEHLDNIKLDSDLDAGDYDCTMTYYLIDEEQNVLTTVNMWVLVKIGS